MAETLDSVHDSPDRRNAQLRRLPNYFCFWYDSGTTTNNKGAQSASGKCVRLTFVYFAYGSNMLTSRLVARCASAQYIGNASVENYALKFSKKSLDGSGKATLVGTTNGTVQGALFEVEQSERAFLDKAEGSDYERVDDFIVRISSTGEEIVSSTYVAVNTYDALRPYDWYLALVIAGANLHSLDVDYRRGLRLIKNTVDLNLERKSRLEALRALEIAGYKDYRSVLIQ